ncbi:MAG TPA: alpha/beta hydrolase [Steroidobacteraceae bacterium]|nr:alpha/beta hydrolase [Steroidobacteraceae bacterium]
MLARVRRGLKLAAGALALVLVTIFAVRAFDAWRAPPLKLWHTVVPRELVADEIDAASWDDWMKAESRAMNDVLTRVTDKLPAGDRVAANRFFAKSPMNPARLATDWNRSQVLVPEGTPRGAAVLLHGLTDSPYSLRHLAAFYRDRGFVAVTIRMPGHGTVPGGLTQVDWRDWMAATRLAVRHARELAGPGTPLHVVGYSNGGALAMKYALDTLADKRLERPKQIVLISPMIGITSFARFAGVLGWPAVFPPFAKAAWLDVLPEYNPIKYNSFPVNGARQSSQLVRSLDAELARYVGHADLVDLPPVLTFQSALDSTVSVSAVFDGLYARLPAVDKPNAVVLFDYNRNAAAAALIDPAQAAIEAAALAWEPRPYARTVVMNGEQTSRVEAVDLPHWTMHGGGRPLAQEYPAQFYSLSHVALPFPMNDPLYGVEPASDEMGVHLGTVAVRGERGGLVVTTDTLMRASCNPFFDYLLSRIDATLPQNAINPR